MADQTKLYQALADLVVDLFYWALGLVQNHYVKFLSALVLVLVAMFLFQVYESHRTERVDFYTGRPGGDAEELAAAFKGQIEAASSAFGYKYPVVLHASQGYEDNRQHVAQDYVGTVVGLAYDGFGDDVSNVRILAPLRWHYLHVLCRKDFLEYLRKQGICVPEHPRFTDILPHVSFGRMHFGPPNSGTRYIAEMLLRHCLADSQRYVDVASDPHRAVAAPRPWTPGQLAAHGIADWDDMRSALLHGDIDVGILSASIGSGIVKEIARDGFTVLLNLDDVCDAVRDEHRSQVAVGEIAAHAYVKDDAFCPQAVRTLIAREVLIGSQALSNRKAYVISNAVARAMANRNLPIDWSMLTPDKPRDKAPPFAYTIHDGTQRVKEERPSPDWWSGMQVLLWSLAVTVLIELAQKYRPRIEGLIVPSYAQLSAQVGRLCDDIVGSAERLNEEQLDELERRLNELREKIKKAEENDTITARQRWILQQRLSSETDYEMRVRRSRLAARPIQSRRRGPAGGEAAGRPPT